MPKLSRRQFIASGAAAGVMMSIPGSDLRASRHMMANDSVNVGFVGWGGRGAGKLSKHFGEVEGVNITGICDADEKRVGEGKEKHGKAEGWTDMRGVFDSDQVDIAVIATCNHWHCLAAIWATEAGKDVYVEKPLSHSQWEGEQAVAAARRYEKIVQVGTHQRSDPIHAAVRKYLHEDKALGEIKSVQVNRYGVRKSIGKRDTPLEIEKNVAYDLWLGPAQDKPIFRDSLHYDWHWDWNTGSGEMGNWGVHLLDDVRDMVFEDKVKLPKRIFGGGGRIGYNDAGETPNVHFVYFDTGSYPVVLGLSNLASEPGGKKGAPHYGPNSGFVVYCEGGEFHGERGKGKAFDKEGKMIHDFGKDTGDIKHQANFIEAVRKRDRSILKAEIEQGNDSTGWCNLANIAFQAGGKFSSDEAKEIDHELWTTVIKDLGAHAEVHGIKLDNDQVRLSPMLELDVEKGRFTGDSAEAANKFIKREYRKGYEVPELAGAALAQ